MFVIILPFIIFAELAGQHAWHYLSLWKYEEIISLKVNDHLERVDSRFLSVEDFINRFEKSYTPVILTNVTLDWPARKKWTLKVCICSIN